MGRPLLNFLLMTLLMTGVSQAQAMGPKRGTKSKAAQQEMVVTKDTDGVAEARLI